MIINWFYKFFDFIISPFMYCFVKRQRVITVLKKELNVSSSAELDLLGNLFIAHLDMIHARVSTLIGHVSIMLAVLTYSLSIYPKDTLQSSVALLELSLYLFCTIVCIRCLRAYGFELNISDRKYKKEIFNDLVLRYASYRVINFLVIALTIVFVLLVVLYPPIKFG